MNSERFLEGIAIEARRTLSSSEIEALVADARTHLEDSIQARIELGDSPEAAERQAIEAFGRPKDILRQANALHRSRFQGLFLGCATAGGLGWAFALFAFPVLPREAIVGCGIVFFSTLAAFVRASEVRRPWTPILFSCVVFWLAFTAICATWIQDYSLEGWLLPRFVGPLDPLQAAKWSTIATLVFSGYLALAYLMARSARASRSGENQRTTA